MKRTKQLVNTAFFYALLAMAGGVFYREFTKFNGVPGGTSLGFVHGHLFMLGMLFFLVAALLEERFTLSGSKLFDSFYVVYNIGLLVTAGTFVWRGVLQVLDSPISKGLDASISGVAGLGHVLLGTGIVLFFIRLRKRAWKPKKS